MIRITCSGCGKKLEAPEESAGKKGKCSCCRAIFEIPGAGAETSGEDAAAGKTGFGEENTKIIIKALENLDEARKYKTVTGGINRTLALKFQSMLQGSMLPKDIVKELKSIIKEHGKGSDVFAGRLKTVTDCLNDLKRRGIGEDEIRKEWAVLAKGGWKKFGSGGKK